MRRQLFSFVAGSLLISGIFASPTAATVLWDNGPMATCTGCGADNADESATQPAISINATGFDCSIATSSLVADDFVVDGGVWDITRITVFAYQTFSPTASTIDDFRFSIYDGPPDDGGSSVIYGGLTNAITDSDWTNIYRVIVPGNPDRPIMRVYAELAPGTLKLPPGTYWLVWQVDGSVSFTGPWCSAVSILGQAETGNAKQFFAGSWSDRLDGTSPQGLPFLIEGSKVANFNFATGTLNIPLVTIDGSSKRYKVEMDRIGATWEFGIIKATKNP